MIKYIKIFLIQILTLVLIFLLFELICRSVYPEFSKNQVFKNISEKERISKGKKQYTKKIDSINYRASNNNVLKFNKNYKTFWFFGDSVTNGYGVRFTETYYYNLKRILDNLNHNFNYIATSGYGNNLSHTIDKIEKNKTLFKENDYLIYQFNYNDIIPISSIYSNTGIVKSKKSSLRKYFVKIDEFRFTYLNRSAFIKTLTHYASILSRKTNGDCKSRGIDSLGQYFYAYGHIDHQEQSLKAWDDMKDNIKNLQKLSASLNMELMILISPVSLQVPMHEKYNMYNLEPRCGTIDPYNKFLEIVKDLNIQYIDPLIDFRKEVEIDIAETNFKYLFFDYDTNHPNAEGHKIIAYSILKNLDL